MTQAPAADRSRPQAWARLLPDGPRHRVIATEFDYRWQQGLARALVVIGVLFLLFAAYQLWGTGVVERQAQRSLTRQLESATTAAPPPPGSTAMAVAETAAEVAESAIVAWLPTPEARPVDGQPDRPAAADSAVTDVGGIDPPVVAVSTMAAAPLAAPLPRPAVGEAVGRLELPTIGVTKTVAEGVDRDTLRTGPGRYPSTALPGEGGNLAIAGHRTTHGAPFADIDRLAPGDRIHFETPTGRFTYEVIGHPDGDGGLLGHRVVEPSAVDVVADYGDDRLTLTACHPKYSARQRIVVSAVLVEGPGVAPARPSAVEPTAAAARGVTDEAESAGSTGEGGIEAEVSGMIGHGGIQAAASSVPHPDAAAIRGTDTTTAPPPAETPPAVEATARRPVLSEEVAVLAGEEIESLGWQAAAVEPTLLWAMVTVLGAFAAWVVGRFWPTRLVYPAAGPFLAVPLVVCFYHLERVLPVY